MALFGWSVLRYRRERLSPHRRIVETNDDLAEPRIDLHTITWRHCENALETYIYIPAETPNDIIHQTASMSGLPARMSDMICRVTFFT